MTGTLHLDRSPPPDLTVDHDLLLLLPWPSANMDVNFRKIDIDQYDEDVLLDSELYDSDPRDPAQALEDTKQNAVAVRSSLARCAFVPQHVEESFDRKNGLQKRLCRGSNVGA